MKDKTFFDREKAKSTLVWVVIASLVVFVHWRLSIYTEDDAYIHFRVARNFIQYGTPYFNPGEPVKTSSSSGWTLFLAVIFKLFTGDPRIVAILNSLITTAGAIVFTQVLKRMTPNSVSGIYYWLFSLLYISLLLISSIGLMETPLALLLLGIGLYLFLTGNRFCFVFLGAAVFFRLELLIIFAALLLYTAFQNLFSFKDIVTWSLVGILPFAFYDLHYWGTLIPNTILAKQIVYTLRPEQVLVRIGDTMFPNLSIHFWAFKMGTLWKIIYFAVLYILLLTSIIYSEKAQTTRDSTRFVAYLLLVSGVLIISAYILQTVLVFNWYIPLYTVPIVFGLYRILFNKKMPFRWLLILLTVPWLVSILGIFVQVIIAASGNNPSLYQEFEAGARVRKYIQVGQDLFYHYPDVTLMASEIGGLGYGFEGHIVDGAGLASPEALRFHPMEVPEERSS